MGRWPTCPDAALPTDASQGSLSPENQPHCAAPHPRLPWGRRSGMASRPPLRFRNARRAIGLALGPVGSTIPTEAELKVVPAPSSTVGGRREAATCRIAPQPAPLSLASSLEALTHQHIASAVLSRICPELGMCG